MSTHSSEPSSISEPEETCSPPGNSVFPEAEDLPGTFYLKKKCLALDLKSLQILNIVFLQFKYLKLFLQLKLPRTPRQEQDQSKS